MCTFVAYIVTMRKNYLFLINLLFSVFFLNNLLAQRSVSCDIYFDNSPIIRTTSFGEENVVAGNYQAVAQQFNGLSGQIKSVLFFGRVNPSTGASSNTLKVVVYQVNLGLPGVILGQQNIVVDSASQCSAYIATFGSPINVNGNVIVSVEPLSSSTNNYFIQRNTPPDGGSLNLIKIKQSNQWFKDLALTDGSYNFDFMILPIKNTTLTASFTNNTSANVVNFTNTSTSSNSYFWDFGDGNNSTLTSPSHSYTASGSYSVKLISSTTNSPQGNCVDSVTNVVNFTLTNINETEKKNKVELVENLVHDRVIIKCNQTCELSIFNALGKLMLTNGVKQGQLTEINVEGFSNGIYFISSSTSKPIKFIKN
jgi:PKD repeat protein